MPRREPGPETLVIDAYNVLHRLPDRYRLHAPDPRPWLEALLRRWRASRRSPPRIVLVYDGGAGEARSRQQRARGFEVRYAGSSATADDLILDIARRARPGEGVTVITSDVHDIVRHLGGLSVRHRSAEEFAGELASIADSTRREREKPEGVKGSEVSAWVREFGFRRERRNR